MISFPTRKERITYDPHKGAAEKYERTIKKREKNAKLPKKVKPDPDKTPLCKFFLLGKCKEGNN